MATSLYNKKYNTCVDFVKGIACFCVVLMHCEFPGVLGNAVQCVSRFCVPFFFMVSGYFSYRTGGGYSLSTHSKKIKHIGVIILWTAALYIPFALIWQALGIAKIYMSFRGVVIWAMFNQPLVITGQMWFLFALLYAYIAYAVIDRFKLQKFCLPIILILFAVYIFMAQGMHLLGYSVPNYIYRNWLIEGLPFFLLGYHIHGKEQDGALKNLTNRLLIVVLIVSTLMCFVERYIMGRDFGVNIVTIPQVASMFCLAVNNSDFGKGIVQTIGKNYSMFVYVLHPFVRKVFIEVYKLTGSDDITLALYLMPVLVCVFTLLLSAMMFWIKNSKGVRNEIINNPNQ